MRWRVCEIIRSNSVVYLRRKKNVYNTALKWLCVPVRIAKVAPLDFFRRARYWSNSAVVTRNIILILLYGMCVRLFFFIILFYPWTIFYLSHVSPRSSTSRWWFMVKIVVGLVYWGGEFPILLVVFLPIGAGNGNGNFNATTFLPFSILIAFVTRLEILVEIWKM